MLHVCVFFWRCVVCVVRFRVVAADESKNAMTSKAFGSIVFAAVWSVPFCLSGVEFRRDFHRANGARKANMPSSANFCSSFARFRREKLMNDHRMKKTSGSVVAHERAGFESFFAPRASEEQELLTNFNNWQQWRSYEFGVEYHLLFVIDSYVFLAWSILLSLDRQDHNWTMKFQNWLNKCDCTPDFWSGYLTGPITSTRM